MDPKSVVCKIDSVPLDPSALRRMLTVASDVGGIATFEGVIRNINHGRKVTHLVYEAYEALALTEMAGIVREADERFKLKAAHIHHRVGSLNIGDTAVIIQVLAVHRNEAFLGARYIIDELKVRVPIWKKEFYDDGLSHWTKCHENHSQAY